MPKPQLVKNAAATEALARTPARDQVADEYAPLANEVQNLQARVRHLTDENSRYNVLKREIRGWFDSKDPEQRFVYETDKSLLEITAKDNEATADIRGMFRELSTASFLRVVNVTQKAFKAEVERMGKPGLFTKFFTWRRTGDRSVKGHLKLEEAA